MNHLTNDRPSFLSIVDKQRLAQHRLGKDRTTRSDPEIAHYRRTLEPVPLADVGLPKMPIARQISDLNGQQYAVLGELAQAPGRVLLFDMKDGSIITMTADQLELVPPIDIG